MNIDLIKTYSGVPTAKITLDNGESFLIHSPVDPLVEAREWVEQFELKPNRAYIVLGFGLGYHVKFLLDILPLNSYIFVIEHLREESLARFAKEKFSNTDWMMDKRIRFVAGPDLREVAGYINKGLQALGIKELTLCSHFPTMAVDEKFYTRAVNELATKIQELLLLDYNFRIASSKLMLKQAWNNLPYIWSNPGIVQFKEKFKGIPAIIVSAGPSLNKNIDQLKKCEDKAVIICAGSTLGALKKHNIVPHFLMVVDPFPGMEKDFAGCLNEKTVLVSPYVIPNELIRDYPGKILFYRMINTHTNVNVLDPMKGYLPETDNLMINLSVAVPAISFAQYIGANPIVLTGQDLSFTMESTHASGVNSGSYPREHCCTVIGVHGEKLLTNIGFKELSSYLAGWFRTIHDRIIVNATEGGVYIADIPHMSLVDVTKKYLIVGCDVFSHIDDVLRSHVPLERSDITQKLSQLLNEIDDCQKYLRVIFGDLNQLGVALSQSANNGVFERLNKIDCDLQKIRHMPAYAYVNIFMELWFELVAFQKKEFTTIVELEQYCWLVGQLEAVFEDLKSNVIGAVQKIGDKSRNSKNF